LFFLAVSSAALKAFLASNLLVISWNRVIVYVLNQNMLSINIYILDESC
jgi:hypothetical protein